MTHQATESHICRCDSSFEWPDHADERGVMVAPNTAMSTTSTDPDPVGQGISIMATPAILAIIDKPASLE